MLIVRRLVRQGVRGNAGSIHFGVPPAVPRIPTRPVQKIECPAGIDEIVHVSREHVRAEKPVRVPRFIQRVLPGAPGADQISRPVDVHIEPALGWIVGFHPELRAAIDVPDREVRVLQVGRRHRLGLRQGQRLHQQDEDDSGTDQRLRRRSSINFACS